MQIAALYSVFQKNNYSEGEFISQSRFPLCTSLSNERIFSSKQSFFSNQVKRLIYVQFTSLPKSTAAHGIQTYLKIRCAISSDPAGSDIVVYHTSTARIFCKTHCTPADCFTSHFEDQLVVAIGPMQHEIAITSTKYCVIQCRNYMGRTRKQDKLKKIRSQFLSNAIETTLSWNEIP